MRIGGRDEGVILLGPLSFLLSMSGELGGHMSRQVISTDRAPRAIGTYSQAIKVGSTVYLSGQIPLDPATMAMVEGPIEVHIRRVFENLKAVAEAAGGSLQDIAKLNVFLTDLGYFARVNEIMAEYIQEPYPARAAVGVASLPRQALVEMDAILELAAAG
jgi:reactive intermediate/imine deaminase